MRYTVAFSVRGRWSIDVEAETVQEAKKIAENAFAEADFEELCDVDGDAVFAEGENEGREYFA